MIVEESEELAKALVSQLEQELYAEDISNDFNLDYESLNNQNHLVYAEKDGNASVLALINGEDSLSYDEIPGNQRGHLENCLSKYDSVEFGPPENMFQ